MEKEFVLYQESLELKQLGFNKPCFATIDQTEFVHIKGTEYPMRGTMFYFTIEAPTYSQAFRWFRDKYFIHHEIGRDYDAWDYELYDFKSGNKHIPTGFKTFDTYEEAELACLRKLIEIVKK